MESYQEKMSPEPPEGDSVCLICLRLYDSVDKNKILDSQTLLYYQNIFDNISKYLSSEIFENCFQWNFAEERTLPVCLDCFSSMEKIYNISQQLYKLQRSIENVINTFTSEILGHHNKLEFLYNHKEPERCITPEIEIKLETYDYDLAKEKDYFDEVVEVSLIHCNPNSKNEITAEDDDDFGDDPLDSGSVADDFEEVDHKSRSLQASEGITTGDSTRTCLLKKSVTTQNEEPRTSTTIGISSDVIVSGVTSKYHQFGLKPRNVSLTKLTADHGQTVINSISNKDVSIKPLRILLTRLQFDAEGKAIVPVETLYRKRKAGIKASAAVKRIVKDESKAGKKNYIQARAAEENEDCEWNNNLENEESSESEAEDDVTEENQTKESKDKGVKRQGSRIPYFYLKVAKRFQCQDKSCLLAFNFSKEIESHISKSGHINQKKYKCKGCSKSFFRKVDMQIHRKKHEKRKLWKCKLCSKTLRSKEKFRRHKYRNHIPKIFKCEKCEKTFLRKINLENHVKSHSDKHFECDKCNEKFYWNVSLKKHRCKSNVKLENCNVCGKRFTSRLSLSQHRSTHLKTKIRKQIPCIACKKVHFVERVWDKCIFRNFRVCSGFKCSICAAVFKTSIELDDHSNRQKHANKKHLLCKLCRKPHYKRRELREHLERHKKGNSISLYRKESVFKCRDCPEEFYSRYLFYNHRKIHKDPQDLKFACKICDKKFKYERTLSDHMNTHTGAKPYKCKLCGKEFPRRTALSRHMPLCTKESNKTFTCVVCDENFKSYYVYLRHLRRHKGEKLDCRFCGKSLKNRENLRCHLETHSAKNHKCNECDLSFNTLEKLEKHKIMSHSSEKPFACSVCDTKFKMKPNLLKHEKIHTRKPFPCDVCGKMQIDKEALRIHKRLHTGKMFSCIQCEKKFVTNWLLKDHVKVVHTKEKKFICEVCQKTFPAKFNLQCHLRTHTGEKPFQCDECSKSFIAKHHLKRHFDRNHSKDNDKFQCDDCGKFFATKTDLAIHKLTHGEKKFHCDQCPFACTRNDNLLSHMRSHTNEKPFVCEICGKGCSRKDNFNVHMKWHEKHGLEIPKPGGKAKKKDSKSSKRATRKMKVKQPTVTTEEKKDSKSGKRGTRKMKVKQPTVTTEEKKDSKSSKRGPRKMKVKRPTVTTEEKIVPAPASINIVQ